ncbi:MAG: extracellular solute-binding protein [Clostridia bacterium]|nr:extracellular solute-binding protein [Clostridia bacterium]
MNKKIVSVGLAAVLAVTTLSACGNKSKKSGAYTEDGRMIITMSSNVAINDNTPVEQYLEEKYNVEIKTYGYGTSYYDKLATMFASKEIPDVMFINDISNWEPLASQGVLAPISLDTIKEAAPDHYKHINEKNEAMWELGKVNGELYAIPKSMGQEYNTVTVWNNNWLKAVGIDKIPETLEEFEVAFDKIKNGDPDGNGKADTYPISGIGGNYYRQFDWLFGAYGVMPEMWTLDEDGKVINGTVTNRAKEALTKLNEWYNKGYINPEFLTDDQSTIQTRFIKQGIATYNTSLNNVTDLTPSGRSMLMAEGEEYASRIAYGPLPEGPYGDRGDWLWGPLSNFVCFGVHMKEDVEKQKVILKILNDLNYNEEVALMAAYGPYGEGYTFYDEEVGKTSGIKQVEKYATDANAKAELGIGFFNLLKCGEWADKSIADLYQNPEYVKEQEKYASWNSYNDLLMRANMPSTLQYAQALQQMKINNYSSFINGTRSLDEWDKFVEEYMNAGGAVLQQEAQEYYDRVIKK